MVTSPLVCAAKTRNNFEAGEELGPHSFVILVAVVEVHYLNTGGGGIGRVGSSVHGLHAASCGPHRFVAAFSVPRHL